MIEFERYLQKKCSNGDRLILTPALILFRYDEKIKTDAGFESILLVAKEFVYKCNINKLSLHVQGFLRELTHMYKTDKYTHRIVMKQDKFILK